MVKMRKIVVTCAGSLAAILFFYAFFTVFFDQAVFVRKNTFYLADVREKVVALTFDDGPSPVWTPKILDKLKESGVKATFFMLGEHIAKYPEIARRVVAEGHDIGNHTYSHTVLIFSDCKHLKEEIDEGQRIIQEVTGQTTRLFRPPKAWLWESEKALIKSLGYDIILWTLNSKDWVTFDDQYIVKYLIKNIRPGDIILFHDSGGVFSTEGGDRHETVLAIPTVIRKLRERGYRFVTVSELIQMHKRQGGSLPE
jgi:peptidoglycan/xylan/chitin deacetylase (PgdA/CDA1 family)